MRFILFLIFLFSVNSLAQHYAIVTAKRAIIYSDKLMTSPIGFIKEGKKIRVGTSARNKGRAVPVVVSKKIAYLAIKDLAILDGSEVILPKDHESIIGLEIKKKRMIFGTHMLVSNYEKGRYSLGQVPEEIVTFTGFNLLIENKKKKRSYQRYGIDYLSFTAGDESLSIPSVVYDWVRSFADEGRHKFRGVFEIGFSPYAIYRVEPYFALNGFSSHFEIGGEYVYYLFEESSLQLKAAYRAQKLLDFNLPSTFETFDPLISGVNISLAYAHSF